VHLTQNKTPSTLGDHIENVADVAAMKIKEKY